MNRPDTEVLLRALGDAQLRLIRAERDHHAAPGPETSARLDQARAIYERAAALYRESQFGDL